MEPIDTGRGRVMATLHDKCANCGVEITVEVDTAKLKPGEIWVQRWCEGCTKARQWDYEG